MVLILQWCEPSDKRENNSVKEKRMTGIPATCISRFDESVRIISTRFFIEVSSLWFLAMIAAWLEVWQCRSVGAHFSLDRNISTFG